MTLTPAVHGAVERITAYLSEQQTRHVVRLPAERELAVNLGVSRSTVRLALSELAKQGRVVRRPQSGWFRSPGEHITDQSSTLRTFSEVTSDRGLTTESVIIHCVERVATFDEAGRLGVVPTSPVIELSRLRTASGLILCAEKTVLIGPRCQPLLGADLRHVSLYAYLQDRCGVFIATTTSELSARGADASSARLLDCPPGDPLLHIDVTGFSSDQRPVLIAAADYRAETYRFVAQQSRTSPY